MIRSFLLFLQLYLFTSFTQASVPIEEMLKSTVRILCIVGDKGGKGTGFVTGEREYIVTNNHVINCIEQRGRVIVRFKHENRPFQVDAEVVWRKKDPDLAFLKVANRLPLAEVEFQTEVNVGDPAWAVGFPGAADDFGTEEQDQIEATVTDGRVSRFIGSGVGRKVQISAPISPGNSGGPAFDEFGDVIGVNTLKSLTQVATINGSGLDIERVTKGEGIGASIVSKVVIMALREQNIPFKLAPSRSATEKSNYIKDNLLSLLSLPLVIMTMTYVMYRLRAPVARQEFQEQLSEVFTMKITEDKTEKKPFIVFTSGEFEGSEIELLGEGVTIGRDANLCQLVVSSQKHPDVSKRHCSVEYRNDKRKFFVEDYWSSNGTYLDTPNNKLRSGEKTEVASKSKILVGQSGLEFNLELK